MTENEAMVLEEAIVHSKEVAERNRVLANSDVLVQKSYDVKLNTLRCNKCADEHEQLAKWLEELKAYRAIGTVEDVAFYKKCYDEESYEYCGEYGTDNCGCKDRMEHLEKKIAEFEAIGTIEEFKALKEKKSEWKYSRKENIATCKNCSYEHYLGTYHQYATNYCPKCGSKMTET